MMEALSCMLEAIITDRLMSSFMVGNDNENEILVAHLLFADDTLIFCDDNNVDNIHTLRALLLFFETIFGLKKNLSKLEIVPVDQVMHISDIANILDCKIALLPMKYLDLSLGTSYKSTSICNGVIEKIRKILVS